jgi:excisionase family DNA binding protein
MRRDKRTNGVGIFAPVRPIPTGKDAQLTVTEAAYYLGVSKRRALRMIQDGVLPAERVGIWLVKREDLIRVAEERVQANDLADEIGSPGRRCNPSRIKALAP